MNHLLNPLNPASPLHPNNITKTTNDTLLLDTAPPPWPLIIMVVLMLSIIAYMVFTTKQE